MTEEVVTVTGTKAGLAAVEAGAEYPLAVAINVRDESPSPGGPWRSRVLGPCHVLTGMVVVWVACWWTGSGVDQLLVLRGVSVSHNATHDLDRDHIPLSAPSLSLSPPLSIFPGVERRVVLDTRALLTHSLGGIFVIRSLVAATRHWP